MPNTKKVKTSVGNVVTSVPRSFENLENKNRDHFEKIGQTTA